ncbi:P4 family phage/plasmid primase-like protein [Panacagrimonas perspica]|uniref:P4 family phage/plasmid primase-like protein n=1 Tax=Panacagrimonas perspica TaxID=381431 RepID=A0A4V3F6I7_9GAMM|nr:phage/plasmid primase, P4 family [Panacagrimonas perspica]TDU32836.1 P4 family phage/plasmid primase-like protein [Panacagrimonas perspica]THD00952.1 hypothetical protein B1810_22085 [Panacagrimonas perspica]
MADGSSVASAPAIDISEARRFLTWLDPFEDRFTFQVFDDSEAKRPELARVLHGTLEQNAGELTALNACGAGIFVTVNETTLSGKRSNENVRAVRCVFADLDGTPLTDALSRSKIEPHCVVDSSPGKAHLYWHACGVELGQFKPLQKAIAARLGGDESVNDLVRVMRLPGFNHRKGTPFAVRIREVTDDIGAECSIDELVAAFEPSFPQTDVVSRLARAPVAPTEPVVIDVGRHEDAVTFSFRLAQTIVATGADPSSGVATIEAESERGRWSRDVLPEAIRAYESAVVRIQSGALPRSKTPTGLGLDWPPARDEPVPASLTSDHANSERLFRSFGPNFVHVEGIGDYVFDEDANGWRHDPATVRCIASGIGRLVLREAEQAAKEASETEDKDRRASLMERAESLARWSRNSEMAVRMREALDGLRYRISVKADRLDRDPELLGTPGGAVDLRTGSRRPVMRSDLITRRTAVAFDPAATCPIWEATLRRIFRSNPEFFEFFGRLAGYAISGHTREQKLFVAYGPGGNGKSTVFEVLADVMGDYAAPAAPGMLMQRKNEAHPAEMADLFGRRLVFASESGQGGYLEETRAKLLTGGDSIKARRLYGDFFTYEPSHTLVLLTNHRPRIRGNDEGIWRRICLVPFAERIPEEERDFALREKLRAEYPGILAWAIRGAAEYLRDGLRVPETVRDATKDYRDESDPIGRFISEMCVLDPAAYISSAALYEAFDSWRVTSGDGYVSRPRFADGLTSRQIKATRTTGERGWLGLSLGFV